MDTDTGALRAQESVGNLDENAGTVTRQRISAYCATMAEISKNFQALADRMVTFAILDIDDKADAAGVMFITRVIETLGRGGGDSHSWSFLEITEAGGSVGWRLRR